MSVTKEELKEKIAEFDEKQEAENERRYSSYGVYEQLHDEEDVEVPSLGKLEYVDSYGGEGSGDEYWVVFKLGEQLFRVDGYYASYDGGELDGEPYEVTKVPTTGFDYVAKN